MSLFRQKSRHDGGGNIPPGRTAALLNDSAHLNGSAHHDGFSPSMEKSSASAEDSSQPPQTSQPPRKRRRKRFSLRRGLLLFLSGAVFFFLSADAYLECVGVPQIFLDRISRALAPSCGIHFHAEEMKAGFFGGIRLENIRVEGENTFSYPVLAAEQLQIRFLPGKLTQKTLLPFRLLISNGRLDLPIFPESGREGAADILSLSHLHADISGEPGLLKVNRLEGRIFDFRFRGKGTFDNLLHAVGARGGGIIQKALSGGSSSPENRDNAQQNSAEDDSSFLAGDKKSPGENAFPEPAIAATEDGKKGKEEEETILLHCGRNPVPLILRPLTRIPLKIRRQLIFFLDRLKHEPFDLPPSADIDFSIDLNHFMKNRLEARLRLPAFQYVHLRIGALDEQLTLENGQVRFDRLHLDLGEDEQVSGSGVYDPAGNTLSATVSGICSPEKLLLFTDAGTRESITERMDFGKDLKIAFSGSIEHLSLRDGEQRGELELQIPELTIKSLKMKNLKTLLKIQSGRFSGEILSVSLPGKDHLEGTYAFYGDHFECSVSGRGSPERLGLFLPPRAEALLRKHTAFPSPDPEIAFEGSLRCDDWDDSAFSGVMNLLLPEMLFCRGMKVKRSALRLDFSPRFLKAEELRAELSSGVRVSGEVSCFLKDNALTASLISNGSPAEAIRMLDPEHSSFLESLTKDIEWPAGKNLIELHTDLFLTLDPVPVYSLSGSIVMTNFRYRGIPFRYGATRFLIDSDKIMILPGASLETENGRAVISVCYDASGKTTSSAREEAATAAAETASSPAGMEKGNGRTAAETAPTGILDFSLRSSLSGNDILRCLYPEWKSSVLDFPESIHVYSRGTIDYRHPENSSFRAGIENSGFLWNGIRVNDMDVNLDYGKQRLSFTRGNAEVADGQISMDYLFDFGKNQGHIAAELSDCDLQSALEELGCKKRIPSSVISSPSATETASASAEEEEPEKDDGREETEKQRRGSLSGRLNATLSTGYNRKLELSGQGEMRITGDDLWSIPLFGEALKYLGSVWAMDNFGSITDIHCLFSLEKDKLVTRQLSSNGGIIALTAEGEYNFQINEFDLRFRAEPLKSMLPFETFPRLFYPLSRFFERRLTGKFSDYRWE